MHIFQIIRFRGAWICQWSWWLFVVASTSAALVLRVFKGREIEWSTPGVVVLVLRRYFLSDQRRCNQPRPNYYPVELVHLFHSTAHVAELNPLSARKVIVIINLHLKKQPFPSCLQLIYTPPTPFDGRTTRAVISNPCLQCECLMGLRAWIRMRWRWHSLLRRSLSLRSQLLGHCS